jgi:hypothetical protein
MLNISAIKMINDVERLNKKGYSVSTSPFMVHELYTVLVHCI